MGQYVMDNENTGDTPLCVDLDGTLIRTDLLVESFFAGIKRDAALVLLAPLWLWRGKANLKRRLAECTDIDCARLPYNEEFLEYLRSQHGNGRPLVLVTASDQKYAGKIAEHLGLFDAVLASDGKCNLAGTVKRDCLSERFGDRGFDYAGNARADLPVFSRARRAVLVNPEPRVRSAAGKVTQIEKVFETAKKSVSLWLEALRLHQWLKNLLVFVPLTAAHQLSDLALLGQASLAFFAFGLCASSAYLLNDLLDLPADRVHPRKRLRPFASGALPLTYGLIMIPVLLAGAAGVALLLPLEFALVLGGYYVSTLVYSFWLKGKVLIDVFLLAGLYTLRVIAGAAAVSIMPSFWLLAFSIFIFLSLAMVKRYAELLEVNARHEDGIEGRGYSPVDLSTLNGLGTASGYAAVIVLALYINSEDIRRMYSHVEAIWLLCPLLLYWISRVWLKAARRELHYDPVVFAWKDRISRIVGALGALILWLAA